VRTDAVVERPDARDERETVGSVAQLSYTLTRQPRGLAVAGQVESYAVSAGQRVTAGEAGAGLAAPLPFRGTVDAGGVRIANEGTLGQRCDGPFGPALTAARETLVRFPPSLTTGTRWADTTSALTCRGDVPATLQTIARYDVVGRADRPPPRSTAAVSPADARSPSRAPAPARAASTSTPPAAASSAPPASRAPPSPCASTT
jgi:hypothetical protein